MSLANLDEQFACNNYDAGKNRAIEILKAATGEIIEKKLYDTEIVFAVEGSFILSYGKFTNREIEGGKIMLFPPGSQVHAKVTKDTLFIICHIREMNNLCECVSLENVNATDSSGGSDKLFYMLDINEKMRKFIDFLIGRIEEGVQCGFFFELKINELLFLLRAYYPKEELKAFFSPLMSRDSRFMSLMYANYQKVKNVRELAEISLYSESGFKKQFQRVFGTSPSEWLRNQKASHIFHDLNCSTLSIKELSYKYNFSSVSSFTTFCLHIFGKTPGQIRAKRRKE